MRTDTGYDVVMLATKGDRGGYQVYRLGEENDVWLFEEEDPSKLRSRIQQWCREHLPEDMAMMSFPIKDTPSAYRKIKQFLNHQNIPFEMKQRTFYIRKKEFQSLKRDLSDIKKGSG